MNGVGVVVDIDQCPQLRLQLLLEFLVAALLRNLQGLFQLSELN